MQIEIKVSQKEITNSYLPGCLNRQTPMHRSPIFLIRPRRTSFIFPHILSDSPAGPPEAVFSRANCEVNIFTESSCRLSDYDGRQDLIQG